MVSERCQCRGQCGRHGGACREIFGQLDLFGGPRVVGVTVRDGSSARTTCQECASSWGSRKKVRRISYTEPVERLNDASRRLIQNL